ncbi:MAG: hypothetical protein IJV71_08325 [Lachnospiraceae bacterium]|nr:hypothetical protein [Lachnospiraceae bacterium]
MNINEKKYNNISDAVAFVIRFAFMIYSYDDIAPNEYYTEMCTTCRRSEQSKNFLAPKSNCKKDYGVLDIMEFGVSEQIRGELIENFDITKEDFREVCNKKGDVVYWQITPQYTMQPISSVNRVRQLKPCRKCGYIQHRMKEYENEKGENYYYITKEVLSEMHDINRTFETFDCFIPKYVVSRRVYDYLIDRYPRMKFEPMFLKEV